MATQFPILEEYKQAGRVRYIGATTTFKPQYATLEQWMRDEPLDFIGIDYAVDNLDAEQRIFPLAEERGIGVLVTDHNVRETLRITDRAYIVHDGVIFRSGTPASLAADEDVKRIYLGAEFRLD